MLIIFPGALGDLICFAPAIRELSRRHRHAAVELMARMELARFAVGRLGIAAAHSIDRLEVSHLFAQPEAPATIARRFFDGFEVVYSLFAAGDPSFRRALSLVTREVHFYPFRPFGEGHIANAYLYGLGIANGVTEIRLDLTAEDRYQAGQILAQRRIVDQPYYVIFPGSGSREKNWPLESFLHLAKTLKSSARPLALLGPAEQGLEALFRRERIDTLSGLELGTVAALAERARFFVGNDSGVSHLASAAAARGVVLFGPTDANRWRPLGKIEVIVRCPLDSLTPDEVASVIRRVA